MNEDRTLLVADTSAMINLNATGCAGRIISALSCRFVVVDVVEGELTIGRKRGRNDSDFLQRLAADGCIEIVALDEASNAHFEQLVIGPASETLDDGEAATIAYAAVHVGIAVLDERKAIRICGERFPNLRLGSTGDLLSDPAVRLAFGSGGLDSAVYNALINGRMRVLPQHVEWVIGLIGPERAAMCASLPYSARSRFSAKH